MSRLQVRNSKLARADQQVGVAEQVVRRLPDYCPRGEYECLALHGVDEARRVVNVGAPSACAAPRYTEKLGHDPTWICSLRLKIVYLVSGWRCSQQFKAPMRGVIRPIMTHLHMASAWAGRRS